MSSQTIEEIFNAFNKLRVLIIGDVMVDSYVYGSTDRISPEAPVPVVSVEKKEKRLGGAANVALNIKAMGATPILCSMIGDDAAGEDFLALLRKREISEENILKSNARKTTVKERVMAGSQQLLRVDEEISQPLSEKEENELVQHIEGIINDVDIIIFQDYDKGVITEKTISSTIAQANTLNVKTIVDPKKRNFLQYKGATLFKPNLKELKEGLKLSFDSSDHQAINTAIKELMSTLQLDTVMITLSEQGVMIRNQSEHHHIPAHIRSISDVSGAGDTVVSVASLALALNLPIKSVASLSNLAGGLVCEYLGVVPIKKDLLLQEAIKNNIN